MSTDKQALLEAINDLIHDQSATFKVNALDEVGKLNRLYPVRLAGDLSILNPILTLVKEDPEAWDKVKSLIDRKRAVAGFDPLWPESKPLSFADRKNEYQRQLMAKRRERANRAADIENMQRSERDQLIGNARLEFMRTVTNTWGKQRDARIEQAKSAAGRKLTKAELDTIRDRFWESVDTQLDEKEALVRREILKPPHLRQRI